MTRTGLRFYLMCLAADRDAARPVRDWLFAAGFEVRVPPTTDEAYAALHTRRLETADAFVIFWGSADESWLEPLLTELKRAKGLRKGKPILSKAIFLADPPTPEKRDYLTRQATLVHGFSPTPVAGGAATAAGRAQTRRTRERGMSVVVDTGLAAPFLGLRYFDEEHSHLFFGRDVQINDILEKLRRSRLVTVMGSSGSGKSSLVRAGVIPRLKAGLLDEAGPRWRIVKMRPGSSPIASLTRELEKALAAQELEVTLRRGPLGLVQAVEECRLAAAENVLIVADQFEEIFRYQREASQPDQAKEEAAAFVKLLLEATSQRTRADLRDRDDAIRLSRQLRPVPRPARAHQRRASISSRACDAISSRTPSPVPSPWRTPRSRRACCRSCSTKPATTPTSCRCCSMPCGAPGTRGARRRGRWTSRTSMRSAA